MKCKIPILLLAALAPAHGQDKAGALDPGDIRNFLVQSQMVEYKPHSRRDPFAAMTESVVQSNKTENMLIDEMTIVGRVIANNKPYVVMLDPGQYVKQFPVGHRFTDGEITAITDTSVVFNQWDPALGSQSGKRIVTKVFSREGGRQ